MTKTKTTKQTTAERKQIVSDLLDKAKARAGGFPAKSPENVIHRALAKVTKAPPPPSAPMHTLALGQYDVEMVWSEDFSRLHSEEWILDRLNNRDTDEDGSIHVATLGGIALRLTRRPTD